MKRFLSVALLVTVVSSLGFGLTAPRATQAQAEFKIGLVTDVGQVDDRSFNQSAWEGAQKGAEAVGGSADYVETKDPNDYATNIKLFADQDYDVIVTVGFALGDATAKAAAEYPDIHFIGVDQFQGAEIPNVTGLIFHEAAAGFLAGVLAGNMTKTGTIAGVFGTDQVPPVVAYKEGYEAGARYVKPDVKIISTYHPGGLAVAFVDPAWGAQTAGQAADQGADVIFAAGGKTGNGGLEEIAKRTTKDKPLYCIGVDTDQWDAVPAAQPCLISSAMKLISDGVVDIVKQIKDDTVKGGNYFGLTGIADFHDFASVVPDAVKQQLKDVKTALDEGKLDPLTGKAPEMMEMTPEATASN